MTPFELAEPNSLREAIGLLDPDDATVRPIAGGTALMLMMKAGVFRPARLVSLRKLGREMSGIAIASDGALTIGAMTPLSTVEHSADVARVAPVIPRAMRRLSNIRVRNVATIGGNLAHGDPHMDLPPILVTLGARVRVVSPRGERWLAVPELIVGYYQVSLERDELIAEIEIPPQPADTYTWYEKFSALSADDWPSVGVAVWYRVESTSIVEARIAVSAATERPVRAAGAEAALIGAPPTSEAFSQAADAALAEIEPLDDIRGSAAYKGEMVRVHVRRALEHALQAGLRPME